METLLVLVLVYVIYHDQRSIFQIYEIWNSKHFIQSQVIYSLSFLLVITATNHPSNLGFNQDNRKRKKVSRYRLFLINSVWQKIIFDYQLVYAIPWVPHLWDGSYRQKGIKKWIACHAWFDYNNNRNMGVNIQTKDGEDISSCRVSWTKRIVFSYIRSIACRSFCVKFVWNKV